MKRASKRAVLAVAAVTCAVLTMGCETMSDSVATDEAAEAMLRSRVLGELREAQRLGVMTVGEEDIPWFTDEQARLIVLAGDQAATGQPVAAKSR